MLLWRLMDGLRGFKIKTYTLTMQTCPGKSGVIPRLELRLSNHHGASAADVIA
jgi:hypothetical protein